MKKDIQRAALAAIIGAFALMTGCDQSNDSNMKDHGNNGKMQDSSKNQGMMNKGMNQSAKPMPNGSDDQMNDLNQSRNNGSSYDGNGGQKKNGSQYHYYCD